VNFVFRDQRSQSDLRQSRYSRTSPERNMNERFRHGSGFWMYVPAMSLKSFLIILILAVTVVGGAVAVHSHGRMHRWIMQIHGRAH